MMYSILSEVQEEITEIINKKKKRKENWLLKKKHMESEQGGSVLVWSYRGDINYMTVNKLPYFSGSASSL